MQRALVFLLMTFCTLAHAEIDYFQRPIGARTEPEAELAEPRSPDSPEEPLVEEFVMGSTPKLHLSLDAELGSNYDVEQQQLGGSFALGAGMAGVPLNPELNLTLTGTDLGHEDRTSGGEVALKLRLWASRPERPVLSLGLTPKLAFGNGTVFTTTIAAAFNPQYLSFKLSGGPRVDSSELGYVFGASAGVSLASVAPAASWVSGLSVLALMKGKAVKLDASPTYFLGSQLLFQPPTLGKKFRVGLLGGVAMPGFGGPSVELSLGYAL
jgi:hypothetical protein